MEDDDDSSQTVSNPQNTASLVGLAVHKTENLAKESGVLKSTPATFAEDNRDAQSDGILKEQRARLRKSSRPVDSGTPIGLDHDAQSEEILKDQRAKLRKHLQPESSSPVDDQANEFDEVRQHLRPVDNPLPNGHVNGHDTDINGNNYPVFVENGEISPKRNGYQSHGDSSSVSSSSYYGDIEDVAKEMYDLADGVEDVRL